MLLMFSFICCLNSSISGYTDLSFETCEDTWAEDTLAGGVCSSAGIENDWFNCGFDFFDKVFEPFVLCVSVFFLLFDGGGDDVSYTWYDLLNKWSGGLVEKSSKPDLS